MNRGPFNIRVYGILIDQDTLLVSDERYGGLEFTKFRGGGLEAGEGTHDCLIREFQEELNTPIEVIDHFYTTHFYQPSAFDQNQQLMSIYYKVQGEGALQSRIFGEPLQFEDSKTEKIDQHRWVALDQLKPEMFKWPVDKYVCQMILDQLSALKMP